MDNKELLQALRRQRTQIQQISADMRHHLNTARELIKTGQIDKEQIGRLVQVINVLEERFAALQQKFADINEAIRRNTQSTTDTTN